MFVHLRGRSTYSMLEGIGSFASIFQKAKDLGQNTIGLTDLYGLYGVVDFYSKAKGYDVKPLIGVELPFVPYLSNFQQQKGISHPSTITLLVRDAEGYHNLLRLVSAAYEHTRDDIPFVDSVIIKNFASGMIILIGGLNSYVHQISRDAMNTEVLREFIDMCKDAYGVENCYIDITAQSYKDYLYLKQSNDTLITIAKNYGLSLVVTSGYCYPEPSQKTAYETALAIKDGKRAYDPDARKVAGNNHHILSEQEVRSILQNNEFSDTMIDQLFASTAECADRCTTKITLGQALFPNFETPDDVKGLYEKYNNILIES